MFEFDNQFLGTIGTGVFADDENMLQARDLVEESVPFGDHPLK
jgi:hypothetical protein